MDVDILVSLKMKDLFILSIVNLQEEVQRMKINCLTNKYLLLALFISEFYNPEVRFILQNNFTGRNIQDNSFLLQMLHP